MSRRDWLLVLATAIGLALLRLLPVLSQPAELAIGSADSDTPKHLWTLWWMREELWRGEPGPLSLLLNWPAGVVLFPIELGHAPLAVLLPLDPVPLANLIALADLALTGICAGWLGWQLTGRRAGALATAVLFEGSTWVAFTLHVGVGELRQAFWLPLCLGLVHRLGAEPRLGRALVAGLALAAATLSSLYYGLFLALGAVVVAAFGLSRRSLPALCVAALVAGLLAWPGVRFFSATYGEEGARLLDPVDAQGAVQPALLLEVAAVDQLVFAPPPPITRQERGYGGGRYLGVFGLGLGLAGVVIGRRAAAPWLVAAAGGALLALGPVLIWDGAAVRWGGEVVRLPGAWLAWLLSVVATPVHFPMRFLALSALGIAALGGIAVGRRPWLALLLPLWLADQVRSEPLGLWPATTRLPDLGALRAPGDTGPMADLSLLLHGDPERRLLGIAAQLATGRPTHSAPLERLDQTHQDGARAVLQSGVLAGLRGDGDLRAAAWLLRQDGFEAALLTGADAQGPLAAALSRNWQAPLAVAPDGAIWAIPSLVPSPVEAQQWQQEAQRRQQGADPD